VADEEHVRLLKEKGVKAWHKWRKADLKLDRILGTQTFGGWN
jgi:hypothetical protein